MKTALISGGMGGVGQATARALAKDGYRIVLLTRKDTAEAKEFLATLPGKNHMSYLCDVTDEKKMHASIAHILSEGPIDVCIHAAVDPIVRKFILDMDAAEFHNQFQTAVFGGFNLFTEVGRHMREARTGVLIGLTTSALEEDVSTGAMAGYLAAKAALKNILRELTKQLATSGVRVYAVAPGFLETKLNADIPARAKELMSHAKRARATTEDVGTFISALLKADMPTGLSFGEPFDIRRGTSL